MSIITQPLREEHKDLWSNIENLRIVADSVGETSTATLSQDMDLVVRFLTQHLIPHAEAEDQALYPMVGQAMGAAEATATMSRDHVEVAHLTNELKALNSQIMEPVVDKAILRDVRRVLYRLYALVKVHFGKEEEIYLPMLDQRLTAEEGRQMFDNMERAAHEARAHIPPAREAGLGAYRPG